MENKNLIIISCGKDKLTYPAPASEMYISPLFTKTYDLAKRIGGDILISSAKYGLITPDTMIEPYDLGIIGPWYEYPLWEKGKISLDTRVSLGKWRRKRNKILGERYLKLLNMTNEHYDMTYVAISEYYIPYLEKNVLIKPYKNLLLGGKGIFSLKSSNFIYEQYDRLDELPIGFRKQHVKWYYK